MKSFKTYLLENHLNSDDSYGDIARDVKNGKTVPIFCKRYQTMDFLKQTGQWSDAALATIDELLDKYEQDEVFAGREISKLSESQKTSGMRNAVACNMKTAANNVNHLHCTH